MDVALALAALVIGFSAGLRSATPWAVLSVAAFSGFIRFPDGWFSLLGLPVVTAALVVAALGEYFVDKLPSTPNRTAFPLLFGRIASGALAAVALATIAGSSPIVAALLGGIGAIGGAFGGFNVRTRLSARLNKLAVAIGEDAVAILIAVLAVTILVRTGNDSDRGPLPIQATSKSQTNRL